MKTASVAEVKAQLSSFVNDSAVGNGKAVAVLLGVHDDEELERLLLAHSSKLHAILGAADRRIDTGAGVGHDEFWQKVASADRSANAKTGKKRPPKRRR